METRFCVGEKVRMKDNVAHIGLPESSIPIVQ